MNVFIGYRRDDTQDLAGRIADRLRADPGIDNVFIDVDGIEPGVDFVAKIRVALAESDVCMLLIGRQWRGAGVVGQRPRIFEDRDFVRLEAASALAGTGKVVPVLANGAQMPEPEELPEDLRRLAQINAVSIRHAYFEHDIDYLIDVLLSRKKPGRFGSFLSRHPFMAGVVRAIAGALAALALLLAGAAVHGGLTHRSLDEDLGGPGQVWLLIVGVLAIGVAIPVLVGPGRRAGNK